jgi:hypothetical protein
MTENKIETATYSTTAVERRTSPISFTDDIFHSTRNSRNLEVISQTSYEKEDYQQRNRDITDNTFINWEEPYKQSSSNNAIDQLVNQTMSTKTNEYPLNQDPNPEHIRRHNNDRVTYRQDVAIRYLQPPTPPPPGPVIIREIRAPQPPEAPPLVIRQRPPVPVTPPPIVIRERPPVPPQIEPPRIVSKYLPAPPPPARKVIIERQAPLPQKPQPIIIEKWLPYKPSPERRVVVERAQPLIENPIQKNTVITYDPPHVDLVKNVRDLGTVRVDPHMYTVQYGSNLSSSEYVLNTMTKYGIGNNYTQMVQIQTSPRSSIANNNFMNQQSITYGEHSASSTYQLQNGDQSEYIEKTVEEIILPDGRRKYRSDTSGSNEQEVLRLAEI